MIEKQGLKLEAVFTHHACADELTPMYKRQCELFEAVKKESPPEVRFHSCNSAALFRSEKFAEDMARVGIAAYGCMELPPEISEVKFKPVLSLYATKVTSRELLKGEIVGYGATYVSQKDEIVSTYDIGYGDGFLRSLSNSYQTPENVKIAGRISMDNSSFLCEREELLIFDDASAVSAQTNTISYEILTSLKSSLKRQVI
jgi:alanine racemase